CWSAGRQVGPALATGEGAAHESERNNAMIPNPLTRNRMSNTMSKHKQAGENSIGTLAEDARALMAATADVAGDTVAEARQRLATALENGKELVGRIREKAVERAKAA